MLGPRNKKPPAASASPRAALQQLGLLSPLPRASPPRPRAQSPAAAEDVRGGLEGFGTNTRGIKATLGLQAGGTVGDFKC